MRKSSIIPGFRARHVSGYLLALSLVIMLMLPSCAALILEDCPKDGDPVLGKDNPRIRSSRIRMFLADPAAAAAHVVPYAAMSAYAYSEDQDCGHKHKLTEEEKKELEMMLNEPDNKSARWERISELEKAGACEDDLGLFYHVWKKESADAIDITLAFRGTWGAKDWYYGNARWFTRFITKDDQYRRSEIYAKSVIDHFRMRTATEKSKKVLRFYATGHSLGGGLAQHVLYKYPRDFLQTYAFDPSSVTGFTDQDAQTQIEGCACLPELETEARIYRVYESYEILANLRIFHKLFFPPTRHVHEIRFPFSNSTNVIGQHSMVKLATSLAVEAKKKKPNEYASPWYSGVGSSCTSLFENAQQLHCKVDGTIHSTCP